MPVRPELLRRERLAIEQAVARLRSVSSLGADRRVADALLRWGVKRGLQLAAETVLDAGNDILGDAFHETADHDREVPPRLASLGVISEETAQRLRGLAAFRNLLAHDYADVDPARGVEALARLDDLEAVVADVDGRLSTRRARRPPRRPRPPRAAGGPQLPP